MTRPLRSIVFDLDGTLIDSAPVFVRILNAMLAERASRRRVTIADVRPFASLGGPALVGGALAEDCGDLTRAVEDFRARYRLFPTPPESLYAGVADGVRALAALGFPLAICSNKPQTLCEKIIADLDLGDCFPVIVGSSPDRAMKPAPDLLDLALARLGSAVAECLYVGDSEVDLALAETTGVRFALLTYGYASEPLSVGQHAAFDDFSDLVGWITASAACLPGRVPA